ncbi:MAG: hypothetical protein P8L85_19660, partial [Rubripirellula sp.]|nr:hypothetical protein [Rubripirellula sp.]
LSRPLHEIGLGFFVIMNDPQDVARSFHRGRFDCEILPGGTLILSCWSGKDADRNSLANEI